jgi:hypothetical protein
MPLGMLQDPVLDKEQSIKSLDKEWSSLEYENLKSIFLFKMSFGY